MSGPQDLGGGRLARTRRYGVCVYVCVYIYIYIVMINMIIMIMINIITACD